MRWDFTEFLLKGIYLGLLLMVALHGPGWAELAWVGTFTLGGLVLSLAAAAVQKVREGYRPRGRPFGFVLFLLLENPGMVYAGLIAGLALGAYNMFKDQATTLDVWAVGGGAILGVVLYLLRIRVRDRQVRLWLGLGLAVALVGTAFYFRYEYPELLTADQLRMIPVLLLMGIPGFYLLTFASLVEESEVEIAAICAALGVALCFLQDKFASSQFGIIGLVIPVLLYFVYTRRVLPGLRVFKHTLRGLSYAKVGQIRPALVSLNRALQLDPQNPLARDQLWELHKEMDIDKLKKEPETLALVNYNLCLERVAWLLLLEKPRPAQVQEAQHLLDLVADQKPALEPRCAYWRAVALLHQRHYDEATRSLESVLRETEHDSPHRRAVLFQAWQLALVLHPEMNKRVGSVLLARAGRRMEAIAAVERQLELKPEDASAWELKRLLYSPLTEAEYNTAALPDQGVLDFDHGYAQQLGLALVEDRERWQRGCEFLRIAARGLPTLAPTLYVQLAKTHEGHGDLEGLWHHYHRAMQVARKVGVANLKAEDAAALFVVVKQLGEHEMNVGDIDTALDAFKFYSQNERAGVETYRTLAELFQRKAERCEDEKDKLNNLWFALHCTEHALSYSGAAQDKDLVERKDRYYYTITPEDLKERLEQVRKWFDVNYCLEKARWVLDKYNGDLDLLDWGSHLAELAHTAEPGRIQAKLLMARIRRLKGDISEAASLFEEIRQNKPEKFASEEEEDSWFLAHRLLGDMYLDEKPDQAVLCFQVYRNSQRAGADTMYKLGRAYENLGDFARAAKCYEHVTAFEGHPLFYEAREAIDRVRRTNNPVG
jgi:tetratricopeptide (TPR) repeat protein